jgi:hypothetical protein
MGSAGHPVTGSRKADWALLGEEGEERGREGRVYFLFFPL